MIFRSAPNLNKLELLNPRFQMLASDPGSPVEAQFYYHSGDKLVKVHNGTSFINLGVTDHGLLSGLGDDDHAQYHTDGRALTWLGTRNTADLSEGANLYYTDARVRLNRLDQMAAPTGSVSVNSQKITNLANGTAAADAVNFAQLEQARQGIRSKPPVEVAAPANVNIANPGTDTFDTTVTVANGESILLPNQTTATEKGIYVFNGSGVAMTRRDDADTFAEIDGGAETFVQGGSTYGGKVLRQLAEIASFAGQDWQIIGAGTTYTAGDGLTESPAGTFNVVGTSGRIVVSANAIDLDTAYVGQASITTLGTITTGVWNGTFVAVANGGTGATTAAGARTALAAATVIGFNVGDGAATAFVLTHNLNTRDVKVEVYLNSTPWDTQICDVERTSVNTVTVRFFGIVPTTDQFRALVEGVQA